VSAALVRRLLLKTPDGFPAAGTETHPASQSKAGKSVPGSTSAGAASAEPRALSRSRFEAIGVRGARVHNLRNIDCEIPHNALTVVTGLSGSGKSSLAFDTIYAEGQRRYIESLSAYARQFLERMEKPDVDEIEGLAPAVAIRQKNTTRSPRSTVATATEIYDYLRLLFARIGATFCPVCGNEVRKDDLDRVAERVLALKTGERFYVLFPLNPGAEAAPVNDGQPSATGGRAAKKKSKLKLQPGSPPHKEIHASAGSLRPRLQSIQQRGFTRLFQDGKIYEFSEPEPLLDADFTRPIYVLVDRLTVDPEIRQRLIDSVEVCYREAGEAVVEVVPADPHKGQPASPDSGDSSQGAVRPPLERLVFNERFECKHCKISYPEPEPPLFSFNSPTGACPRCQGFGNTVDFDLDLVIPDKGKTLAEGAVEPWTKPRYRVFQNEMKRAARAKKIPLTVPFHALAADDRRWLIEGGGGFEGVRGFFRHLERKKYKLHVRVFLSRYRGYTLCPECQGGRLRREALNVRIQAKNIVDVCRMAVREAYDFFNELHVEPAQAKVAEKLLDEIRSRLKYLYHVGLEYLSLDRLSSSLSGGEAQRIQLATALGSNLVGTLYVLDEPSIGLHARDTARLIEILKNLRDLGNTILVVEHDAGIIRASDRVLDLGPGAGELGGRVVYSGDAAGLAADPHSLTGRYLSGELEIPVPAARRAPGKSWLKIHGARQHNLKSIDVAIPLGLMVCVSGVSGSGKSTLVHDVLYNALMSRRGVPSPRADYGRIDGDAGLANIVLVDQSPLGRTPRSNPVTYIKAFDGIREVFAATPEAKKRGYMPGHFSFNIPGGRCETCQGDGTVTVEMQFLADIELVCEECGGKRFKPGVLEVQYRGKNIHEVLQMTVREALAFFSQVAPVAKKLRVLDEVGLGYLRLGQSATTLSGGEAQRVRLAAYMSHPASEKSLFIFDEPTTGLHFDDINKLLAAFRRLNDLGATTLIIEHNLEVLKAADWMIDLGPEGGGAGGYVVAAGTPEELTKHPGSHTGKFLAPYFSNSPRTAGSGHVPSSNEPV
jgi:excinuclease ABC subunit A